MRRLGAAAAALALCTALASPARAETRKEYETRFALMLDFATRLDDAVRSNLSDKGLARYAQAVAEKTVAEAERITPPKDLALIHPHFVLVLENIERSFFYASRGELGRYRHHATVVRKERELLEILAEQAHLDVFRLVSGIR